MTYSAYCRVSTDQQEHRSQTHAINTYLSNHHIKECRWFTDTITGSTMTRDGMDALNKSIFMGETKTVIVFKLDRIARDMRAGIDLISDWCNQGVRLISISEQIDMSGPVGRMIAAVLLGLAEIERNNIRERVKAGMAVAKAAGKCKGRKPGTYKASTIRAKDLRMKGLTYEEVAKSMGVGVATVYRYMNL